MYNNSEFCYYSSIVIKNRLPIDYSLDKEQTTSPPSFSSFGLNQLLMLGIITLLLLFRYIRKIKIGDIIDIEFDALEKHVDKLLDTTETAIKGKALTATDFTDMKEELLKAKGNIETIKAKALKGS